MTTTTTNLSAAELKIAYQMRRAEENGGCRMIDTILAECGLKNDAALAKTLRVPPSVISKIRSGVIPPSPMVLIRLHEFSGIAVARLKTLAGLPRFDVQ